MGTQDHLHSALMCGRSSKGFRPQTFSRSCSNKAYSSSSSSSLQLS